MPGSSAVNQRLARQWPHCQTRIPHRAELIICEINRQVGVHRCSRQTSQSSFSFSQVWQTRKCGTLWPVSRWAININWYRRWLARESPVDAVHGLSGLVQNVHSRLATRQVSGKVHCPVCFYRAGRTHSTLFTTVRGAHSVLEVSWNRLRVPSPSPNRHLIVTQLVS